MTKSVPGAGYRTAQPTRWLSQDLTRSTSAASSTNGTLVDHSDRLTNSMASLFISYSHDSIEHEDRILALADRLRQDGIDARIDQYFPTPIEGWPIWMDRSIADADFVAIVCSETYLKRVMGKEKPGVGLGVLWEAKIIYNHLYSETDACAKFMPILPLDGSQANIPWPLRGHTYYEIDTPGGYARFCRYVKGDLPVIRSLPVQAPESYPASLEARIEKPLPTSLDRRNRDQLLARVRNDWVGVVLDQPLYRIARIELGLDARTNAIERPVQRLVRFPPETSRDLAAGMGIIEVYDDQGQALLILGAPGVGKTTLLAELANDLLNRAAREQDHPMPVLFNLSSWAGLRESLTKWMARELTDRYDVPQKLARRWLETEQISHSSMASMRSLRSIALPVSTPSTISVAVMASSQSLSAAAQRIMRLSGPSFACVRLLPFSR